MLRLLGKLNQYLDRRVARRRQKLDEEVRRIREKRERYERLRKQLYGESDG